MAITDAMPVTAEGAFVRGASPHHPFNVAGHGPPEADHRRGPYCGTTAATAAFPVLSGRRRDRRCATAG
jgi:hypothetical protein